MNKMKSIFEYLLSKSKPNLSEESAIDELERLLLQKASIYEATSYTRLFDEIRKKKSHAYIEIVCKKLIGLYHDGYEYIVLKPCKFKNADEDFKGFVIGSTGLKHAIVIFEIFNVEKMTQVQIAFENDGFIFVREGNMPDKEKLVELLQGKLGCVFNCITTVKDYDDSNLVEFENILDDILK